MNTHPVLRSLAFAGLGCSALLLTACSERKQQDLSAKAGDAYEQSAAAVSAAWDDVKAYTYEKRSDFSASAKAMSARLDAEISKLQAEYAEAQASASRRAAMEELRNAQADFSDKMSALGNATAATWDSAKANVVAAWDRLQAAYAKARAS